MLNRFRPTKNPSSQQQGCSLLDNCSSSSSGQLLPLFAADASAAHLSGTLLRMLHQVVKVSGSYLYSWLLQLKMILSSGRPNSVRRGSMALLRTSLRHTGTVHEHGDSRQAAARHSGMAKLVCDSSWTQLAERMHTGSQPQAQGVLSMNKKRPQQQHLQHALSHSAHTSSSSSTPARPALFSHNKTRGGCTAEALLPLPTTHKNIPVAALVVVDKVAVGHQGQVLAVAVVQVRRSHNLIRDEVGQEGSTCRTTRGTATLK